MRYKGLSVDNPADQELLRSCQMGILKGHGRIWSAYCLLSFGNADRRLIVGLIGEIPYRTAIKQYQDARLHVLAASSEELFCSLSISATGFTKLNYKPNELPSDISFRRGMKWASEHILSDPSPTQWDPYFQGEVDAMVVFASDDSEQLDAATSLLETAARKFLSSEQICVIRATSEKHLGTEHFGFVDGISQPLFFQADIDHYASNAPVEYDPSFDPRDIVLARFPQRKNYLGSYLVFRKIEQDVERFKQSIHALASTLGVEKEFVEAQVLGRFRDGTPLTVSPTSGLGPQNNFHYIADSKGMKCPYHSHVRKMNIRSSLGDDAFRMIARRGVPYGSESGGDAKVGLLFMCYQNDIGRQFEFLQSKWANDPNFPHNSRAGVDPIIGHPIGEAQKWVEDWGVGSEGIREVFAPTTNLKGGEYFFTPSPLLLDEWKNAI
ncbi:Dyp-type peroxidase [Rhizobium leguminosarum]|uniref:Dyp-type peroxidase n=1 Tax=Rhizobium leguminosarum TaxID=384 RepID=UPI003F969150